ncbi:MAG: chemotaxis-specific protein-glutamate methyltransferase CheB [Tunicatimonas sp.]
MPPSPISTLLIEDSGLMRIILSDVLRSDPAIELLATAANGREGLEKARQLRPDVIVTDMMMPELDGLGVVRAVMQERPTPVIVLSSLQKESPLVFEALAAGAFDFLSKEQVVNDGNRQAEPLIDLVKAAAQAQAVNLPRRAAPTDHQKRHFSTELPYHVIAVGASTGGPAAIEALLNGLPANFPIPILIAQHMPEHFIPAFAHRLNERYPFRVKLAERGERLQQSTVYIMPGHTNTTVVRKADAEYPVFRFTSKKFAAFNQPSIDGLFSSLPLAFGNKTIGVVLTGMGRDGTLGLQTIRQQGGHTVGQSASSCVVFGMPKQADEAGAVCQVLPLNEISDHLIRCLS